MSHFGVGAAAASARYDHDTLMYLNRRLTQPHTSLRRNSPTCAECPPHTPERLLNWLRRCTSIIEAGWPRFTVGADQLARVAPAVFLILETSPGNFQAWAALTETADTDLVRRLKKGAGADAGASGATRVAGGINFKAKYAPDFPRVAIRAVNEGRTTTIAELDRLGLVAPLVRVLRRAADPARRRSGAGRRRWPSYARCLEGAPLNGAATGPDTSRADFLWCMIAIDWGWALAEVATRLLTESAKAQAHGRGYAELTVRNAALAVERRGHA